MSWGGWAGSGVVVAIAFAVAAIVASSGGESPPGFMFEVIFDPAEAADFVLTPRENAQGKYEAGTTVNLLVLPKEGWQISSWSGVDGAVVGNTGQINIDSDKTVEVKLERQSSPVPPAESCISSPTSIPDVAGSPIPAPAPGRELIDTPRLLFSFDAPGGSTNGIAWDGTYLWLSDNSGTIFQVEPFSH